jgi:hypothetical protein
VPHLVFGDGDVAWYSIRWEAIAVAGVVLAVVVVVMEPLDTNIDKGKFWESCSEGLPFAMVSESFPTTTNVGGRTGQRENR